MYKPPTRYRIDPYKNNGIVDQTTKMLVCESKDAERYFSGKNNSTKKKVAALDKEIEKLVEERNKLRSKCKHVNAVHKYCGSTGNWSKSDDCYWIEYLCYDCGKVWSTEQ